MKPAPLSQAITAPQRRFLLFGATYLVLWLATWYSAALLASAAGVSLWFLPAGLRFFCLLFFGWHGFLIDLTTQCAWVLLQLATGGETLHEFLSIQTFWQIYGWFVSLLANALVALPLRGTMRDKWNLSRSLHSALLASAAAAASTLAALAGSIRLLALGHIAGAQWGEVFASWLIGDFIGIVTLTPLLMVRVWPGLAHYLKHGTWRRPVAERRVRRVVDLKTTAISVSALLLVFGIPWAFGLHPHLPLFALLLLLPLAAVALRFGLRSSVLAVVVLDCGLVLLIAWVGRQEHALQYQWVMVAIALVGLWLGGSVEARDRLMLRYRDFADVSNDLIWETDRDGCLVVASGRLAKLLAISRGISWQELLAQHSARMAEFEEVLTRGQPFRNLEIRLGSEREAPRWIQLNGLPLFDDAGELTGYRGTAVDVSPSRQAEEMLRNYNETLVKEVDERTRDLRQTVSELETKERHLQVLLAAAPVGVIELDEAGRCGYINANGCALTGCSQEQAQGRPLLEFVHPDDRAYVEFVWNVNRQSTEVKWLEFRMERTNQRCVAHWINLSHAQQAMEGTIMVLTNAAARSQHDERLWTLAHHDALTELPNRHLFRDRMKQALLHARRNESGVALLWIDLDGFKAVNDTFGHAAGDALLREVAQRLKSRTRASDTVARMGGDEFAVVMPGTVAVESAVHTATDLLAGLAEPFDLSQGAVRISGSIGVALYPQHAATVEMLMQHADLALYAAKRAGKNQVQVWRNDSEG